MDGFEYVIDKARVVQKKVIATLTDLELGRHRRRRRVVIRFIIFIANLQPLVL